MIKKFFSSGDSVSGKERFRRWSLNQLQTIEAVLSQNAYSLCQFRSILDFGCSYGRLTRYFSKLAPNAQIYGCDVQKNMINKCRRALPNGTFIVNKPTPPLNFSEEMFDFIFSFSVFTHLSEQNHIDWLKELAGMLKPGGIMLHTTHGYECLSRLANFNPENLAKYKIPCSIEEFIEKQVRYHWVVYDQRTPEYGLSIISKDYILQNWEDYSGLTLVKHIEGAIDSNPEGCHDLVLLVKKKNQ